MSLLIMKNNVLRIQSYYVHTICTRPLVIFGHDITITTAIGNEYKRRFLRLQASSIELHENAITSSRIFILS